VQWATIFFSFWDLVPAIIKIFKQLVERNFVGEMQQLANW
jgi:hypothetical protein